MLVALVGCRSLDAPMLAPVSVDAPEAPSAEEAFFDGDVMDRKQSAGRRGRAKGDAAEEKVGGLGLLGSTIALADKERDLSYAQQAAPEPPPPPADATPARVRQWFPEAFLWRPSVVTDGDGVA
ncbi:MAG: hypothetical protein KC656_05605, partial [Myxococcales bacterium]|nr:hypothetical protein [Myxococcales bacterium]